MLLYYIMSIIPNDFNWKMYLLLNKDLNPTCSQQETINHYVNHGKYENRHYKLPDDFNWTIYLRLNNDLNQNSSEQETSHHYINHGIHENRQYKVIVPYDFDWKMYINLNKDIPKDLNEQNIIDHYLNYGYFENRNYTHNFNYMKKYSNTSDISMFLLKSVSSDYNNSFLKIDDISKNLPRCCHNFKEKLSISVLSSFILIIDFHNGDGGTTFFIESIISKYKKYQTFLIVRNFNGQIYFTINDDYEIEENSFDELNAIKLLLDNKDKIEKIFVNHTLKHSIYFLENLFTLNKEVTTITHDLFLLFNEPQITFNDIDNYIQDQTKHNKININKYNKIITQNICNLYIYNNYIIDKNKIIINELPDFKNSKDLINTSNSKIIVGIIGSISYVKGNEELKKIINYYKDSNIEIYIFGNVNNIESFNNIYPYKNVNELNELLINHKPNILIELSIWPETYSYTLTLAMITQLPILYLKKNGFSVVENRLSKYNNSHPFFSFHELDNLINNKKQDYFYTIEPVIYFNETWDNYFLKNSSNIGLSEITDNYINKNIVLVTSKIVVSKNPFSYVSTRSIYTREQRFIQTINTIKSIRKYIPDCYIVLVDNSEFNKIEYETIVNLTDYLINIIDDNVLNYYTNESPIKLFADIIQQLCFYEKFIKKININNVLNFFKISGRYFINDTFNYSDYNNELNIFKKNKEITDREYYYTSFYKLNNSILLYYFEELVKIYEEKDIYNENTINDIEVIVPSKIQNKIDIENLGITQIFAVWNIINQI